MNVLNVLAADDFNRADNVDIGAVWDVHPGSGQAFSLVSNAIRTAAAFNGPTETRNDIVGLADSWAEVTLLSFTSGALCFAGVILRATSAGASNWYAFAAVRNSATIRSQIEKAVAGTPTVLVSENVTTWAAGDIIRGEAIGTRLNLYRNNVLLLTTTDSAHASGRVGIALYQESATLSDYQLDNWRGGTIAPFTKLPNANQLRPRAFAPGLAR